MIELITELMKFINKIIEIMPSPALTENKQYIYIKEENRRVECVDFLKDVEKYDNNVIPYELNNDYTVKNGNLECKRIICCKANKGKVSNFEFTVVSSTWNDAKNINVVCYDLRHNSKHEIVPNLKSYNGYAKRFIFGLNKAVSKGEDIQVKLNYINEGCMEAEKCYIVADTKYKKLDLKKYIINIIFIDIKPSNVRVYRINHFKRTYEFVEKLFPFDKKSKEGEEVFTHEIEISKINKDISLVYFYDGKRKGE